MRQQRDRPDRLATRVNSVRIAFGLPKPTVSASAISSTPIAATASAKLTTRSCGTLPSMVQPNEVGKPAKQFGSLARLDRRAGIRQDALQVSERLRGRAAHIAADYALRSPAQRSRAGARQARRLVGTFRFGISAAGAPGKRGRLRVTSSAIGECGSSFGGTSNRRRCIPHAGGWADSIPASFEVGRHDRLDFLQPDRAADSDAIPRPCQLPRR